MKKMIIADDEIIIRRGLRKALDWTSLGIEIVGEAEHGIEALALVEEHHPDLMLVDINMPLLNGIELIKKIKVINNDCRIIIITGYDEFEYAREAIRLSVSEYILKPVSKAKLSDVITKVMSSMEEHQINRSYANWAQKQLEVSRAYLLSDFFSKWMDGRITKEEAAIQLQIFDFPLNVDAVVISLSVVNHVDNYTEEIHMEEELFKFSFENIVMEICEEINDFIILTDSHNDFFCFYALGENVDSFVLINKIKDEIVKYLKCNIFAETVVTEMLIDEMPRLYKEMRLKIDAEKAYTPVVLLAKSYIDNKYYEKKLSLKTLSDSIDISPQYLSKLIKNELGMTYKEYLNKVRIEKAIILMQKPMVKMYEVADETGYKSQHYFSVAFKKVKGMSPNDYKSKFL